MKLHKFLLLILGLFLNIITYSAYAATCPPVMAGLSYSKEELEALSPQSLNILIAQEIKRTGKVPAFIVGKMTKGPTFLSKVNSLDVLKTLAVPSRVSGGEQLTLKVVYRRDPSDHSKSQVYLVNTNEFKFHYEFVTAVLQYQDSVESFNKNYDGDGSKRNFNLATLVILPKQNKNEKDKVLLELWSGDTLSGDYLKELYDAVKSTLPAQTDLVFHPLSKSQEAMISAAGAPEIKFITNDQLFKNRPYWLFNEGVAYGYIKFVSSQIDASNPVELDLTDIAVFENVPNDIGLVGGVITSEPQPPLSHVNVKSMNRGTVNMYLKNAKSILRQYDGKPVELRASPNGYTIRILSSTEAEHLISDFWKSRRPKPLGKLKSIINPQYNTDFVRLYQMTKMPTPIQHRKLIQTVGAKAANLGVIKLILDPLRNDIEVESPETIGVPFNFFDFLMQSKAPNGKSTYLESIKEILNKNGLLDPEKLHTVATVRSPLQEVRDLISSAIVTEQMLDIFEKYIYLDSSSPIHFSKVEKIRLRSSTNSEDLDGFTGAGLYDSSGLWLVDKKGRVRPWEDIRADLIKAVAFEYSSIWNERAFLEREWFGINGTQHLEVKAGLAAKFPNGEPCDFVMGIHFQSDSDGS